MKPINKTNLRLESPRLILKPMRVEDISEDYIQGLNDPEVNHYLVSAKIQTHDTVRGYIVSNAIDSKAILLGIFLQDSQQLVGTIRASSIDPFHYCANIGICLFAKRFWKQGFALEALKRLVEYLFNDVGLHYLEAGAYAENVSSVSLFERAGFGQVSRVKNKYRLGNTFQDVIYFGIINPSFDHNTMIGN